MAKRGAGKRKGAPGPGAAFAVLLPDGRYTVYRVIRHADAQRKEEAWMEDGHAMLLASSWIGAGVPSADEPGLRGALRLTHHGWEDWLEVTWVRGPAPEQYVPIGVIEPTAEDLLLVGLSYGGWPLVHQAFLQWRWDHEREQVLAEDAVEAETKAADRMAAAQKRRAELAAMTLESLLGKKRFGRWRGKVKPVPLKLSRELVRESIAKLVEVGKEGAEAAKVEVIKQCVLGFNALDGAHEFIETMEREEICEELGEVMWVCGLGGKAQALIDEWREW